MSNKKAVDMFEFVKAARDGLNPFAGQAPLDDDVRAALVFIASNTPEVVMGERERMTVAIEQMARDQHASGRCARWFARADAATMGVAGEACGSLLADLAEFIAYSDASCVDSLRDGAKLVGALDNSFQGLAVFVLRSLAACMHHVCRLCMRVRNARVD